MKDLTLEVNSDFTKNNEPIQLGDTLIMITPPIDGDYWAIRVRMSDAQSIVAFPKFGTYGLGFQHEDDWNTNLPYTCGTEKIFNHIDHNKGDANIADSDWLLAIKMIR